MNTSVRGLELRAGPLQDLGAIGGIVSGWVPIPAGLIRGLWLGQVGAQLWGSFRIYSLTEFDGFTSMGSWTMSERGWSHVTGYFRVHSWDRGLFTCYPIYGKHDSSWVP